MNFAGPLSRHFLSRWTTLVRRAKHPQGATWGLVLDAPRYELLFRGENASIARASVDAGKPVSAADGPAVVGALTLLGRVDEADELYRALGDQMAPWQRIVARSFLTIALARQFRFAEAMKFLEDSMRERHLNASTEARCLFLQSIAIVRYFTGDLRRARHFAERARGQALLAGFLYGRIFSSDLLGHIEVALGQVHRGLELLEQTRTLAASLGHGWLVEALRVSTASYRVRHGVGTGDPVTELRSLLERDMTPDAFGRPGLLLELSRQLVLRGRASEALDILQLAAAQIYPHRNVRFECQLHLGLAHAYLLRGDVSQARSLLESALSRIAGLHQPGIELGLRGLLHRAAALSGDGAEHLPRIAELTRQAGTLIPRRIWGRLHGSHLVDELPGQDRVGDLIDCAHRDGAQAHDLIMQTGQLGVLLSALQVLPGARQVLVRRREHDLVVIDRGDVARVDRVPELSRKLLCTLGSQDARTKEDLCRAVWGYEYHPERHDGLIYSAISKLRRAHPALESWVEATGDGYALSAGVKVTLLDEPATAVQSHAAGTQQSEVEDVSRIASEYELNLRQTRLLSLVHQRESVDVRTARALLSVSEVTASRDLRALTERKLLTRVGKGRATRYCTGPLFPVALIGPKRKENP